MSPILLAATCTLLVALYWKALHRPLPGIPHHKSSARSLLGDLPSLIKFLNVIQDPFAWFETQCVLLNSPIVQIWPKPFQAPVVVLADFQETEDIMLRRTKEFDRAPHTREFLGNLLPNSTILMQSDDAFKRQRRLFLDTMSPAFIHDVAAPHLYSVTMDLINVWRMKASLAGPRPVKADMDLRYTVMDASFANTFGAMLDTHKPQAEALSRIANVPTETAEPNTVEDKDRPLEMPPTTLAPVFEALVTLLTDLEAVFQSPWPNLTRRFMALLPRNRAAMAVKDEYINRMLFEARQRLAGKESSDTTVTSAMDLVLRRLAAMEDKSSERIPESAVLEAACRRVEWKTRTATAYTILSTRAAPHGECCFRPGVNRRLLVCVFHSNGSRRSV